MLGSVSGDELATLPRTLSVLERALFDDARPVVLGRFEVVRQLGRGGMGVVYLAIDPVLKREVAIKVHHRGADDTSDRRLMREAESLARLRHRNVVTVHEVARSDAGEVFVVMEHVPGPTMRQWVAKRSPALERVVSVFARCARGLHAAHGVGLVHRDFKPDNVLLAEDAEPTIIDFGLARAPIYGREPTRDAAAPDDLVTQDDEILGTPRYMAPELWRGGRPSPASDQFALCVALFEMLTGAPPPGRPSRAPTQRPSSIPRRLWSVVRRGLLADPLRRWPSLHSVAEELERATARRSPLRSAGTGVVVVAGIVGLAFLGADRLGSDPQPAVGADVGPIASPPHVDLLEGPWSWSFDGPGRVEDGVMHLELPPADFSYKTVHLDSGPMSFQNVAIEVEVESFARRADHHEFAINIVNAEHEGVASLLFFGSGTTFPFVANGADIRDDLDLDRIRFVRLQIEDRVSFNDVVTFQVSEDGARWRTLAREEANVTAGGITVQVGSQRPVTQRDEAVVRSVRCVPLDPPRSVPSGRDFAKPEPEHP
jgi:serine/threonine protein kinase